MLPHRNERDRRDLTWLHNFSQDLENDSDMLESLSDEDVQEELHAWGADVEGFHSKLSGTLRAAKLKQTGGALIQWFSPLWKPQWTGQFVGAGDAPQQTHRFRLEQGAIEISCTWKPQQGTTPAYLDFSWKADLLMEGELSCRFVQPDTQAVLADLPLGSSKEGGQYFSSQALGFDPTREKWAIVILVKQAE